MTGDLSKVRRLEREEIDDDLKRRTSGLNTIINGM